MLSLVNSPKESVRSGAHRRQLLFEQYDICDVSHKYSQQESMLFGEKDPLEELSLTSQQNHELQIQNRNILMQNDYNPAIIIQQIGETKSDSNKFNDKDKKNKIQNTLQIPMVNNSNGVQVLNNKQRSQSEIFSFNQLDQSQNKSQQQLHQTYNENQKIQIIKSAVDMDILNRFNSIGDSNNASNIVINHNNNNNIDQEINLENSKYSKKKSINGDTNGNKTQKNYLPQQSMGFHRKWQGGRCFFILCMIIKFLNQVKNYSSTYKFTQLMRNHFQIISDNSVDDKYYKQHNMLKHMRPNMFQKVARIAKTKISQLLPCFSGLFLKEGALLTKMRHFITDNLIIVQPDSFTKIVWDSFILFLLVINIFYIPIKLVFEQSDGLVLTPLMKIFLNDLPGWAFLFDIFMHFNTAYYSKGVVISQRLKILKHYLRTNFFWDMIVVVPFIISLRLKIPFMDSVLLLRTNKMRKIAQSFEQMLNMRQDHYAIYELFKLILSILFIAHFFGCSFYYFSDSLSSVDDGTMTWIQQQNIVHEDWFVKYSFSLYWAVVTMVTIGYGDITPINYQEKLFVVGISLLGCGVFAYSLNSIGTIVQDLTKRSTMFNAKMAQLSALMKKKNLSSQLQIKVKKYFEYLHEEQMEENSGQDMLLNQLAHTLKTEVLTEIYLKVLLSTKFFKMNFSEQFLHSLAPKLRERRFGPEEIIYNSACNSGGAGNCTSDQDQQNINNNNTTQNHINNNNKSTSQQQHQQQQQSQQQQGQQSNSASQQQHQQPQQQMLYFLQRGDVEVFLNIKASAQEKKPHTVLFTLHKGELFGEESFFTQTHNHFSMRALNVVTMVYLTYEDFMDVLSNYPLDWEQFCLIRDNLQLYDCSNQINSRCRSCNQYGHGIMHCPLLRFTPRHQKLIYQSCQSAPQDRNKEYTRKDRIFFSALQDLHILKECAMAWIVQNNPFQSLNELVLEIQHLDELQKSKDFDNINTSNDLGGGQDNVIGSKRSITSKNDISSSSSSDSESEDKKSQKSQEDKNHKHKSLQSIKTQKTNQIQSQNSLESEEPINNATTTNNSPMKHNLVLKVNKNDLQASNSSSMEQSQLIQLPTASSSTQQHDFGKLEAGSNRQIKMNQEQQSQQQPQQILQQYLLQPQSQSDEDILNKNNNNVQQIRKSSPNAMYQQRDQQRKGSLIYQQRKQSFRNSLSLNENNKDFQMQIQQLQAQNQQQQKEKEKEQLQPNNRKSMAILQKFQFAVQKKKSADISNASQSPGISSNNNNANTVFFTKEFTMNDQNAVSNQNKYQKRTSNLGAYEASQKITAMGTENEIIDEEQELAKQYSCLPNFDSFKSYKKYFVHNNIEIVLEKYNKQKKTRNNNKKKQLTRQEQLVLKNYISKLKENFGNKGNYKNLKGKNLANELKALSSNSHNQVININNTNNNNDKNNFVIEEKEEDKEND